MNDHDFNLCQSAARQPGFTAKRELPLMVLISHDLASFKGRNSELVLETSVDELRSLRSTTLRSSRKTDHAKPFKKTVKRHVRLEQTRLVFYIC